MTILRLLWISVAMLAGACSDSNSGSVEDPEKFFQANKRYLETIVPRLQNSKIEGVWPNVGEAKDFMSPEDGQLYAELQQFIRSEALGLITVIYLRVEGTREFRGVTFGMKEIKKDSAPRAFVSLIYTAPGIDPTGFFRNISCKPLDPPAWHLCEWIPA